MTGLGASHRPPRHAHAADRVRHEEESRPGRYSHGAAERYLQLADELLRLKVDALVTDGAVATKAAQRTSQTIPIVFVVGNPVDQGFVASLSHPRKNLTGVAIQTGELTPRRSSRRKWS
jgi:ABC transporter substrate binding protein